MLTHVCYVLHHFYLVDTFVQSQVQWTTTQARADQGEVVEDSATMIGSKFHVSHNVKVH